MLKRSIDHDIPDPSLTPLGLNEQCSDLASSLQTGLELAQNIELIVVSPMQRTLQTAQQTLGWLMSRGVPVMLRAEWQENSTSPCDVGTAIPTMEKRWPQFDWSTVDPVFPRKTGLYEYSEEALKRRGAMARRWLKDRPEKVIAVVSHSGFLSAVVSHRHYMNADFRIFDFADGDEYEKDGGTLVEWSLTEERGGGRGLSCKGEVGLANEPFVAWSKPVKNAPEEVPL